MTRQEETGQLARGRTPAGAVPSCDWVRVENGMITEIRSFYDTVLIRDVLSSSEQDDLGRAY